MRTNPNQNSQIYTRYNTSEEEFDRYTRAKPGETLQDIAARTGYSVRQLLTENPELRKFRGRPVPPGKQIELPDARPRGRASGSSAANRRSDPMHERHIASILRQRLPSTSCDSESQTRWNDFKSNLMDKIQDAVGDAFEKVFDSIDINGNGRIGPVEVAALIGGGGITNPRAMFAIAKGINELFQLVGSEGNRGSGSVSNNGGTSGTSDSSFLQDPSLSLEEKLMLLMAKLAEDLDEQIQEKMEALDASSSSDSKDSGKSEDSDSSDSSNTQMLQTQLESLMQRREQMFQTMQNMLKSLHQTSSNAIANLK